MTQSIDPNDWFLNFDPLTQDNNIVLPLIDGKDMMEAVYEEILSLQSGDFCFYSAWQMAENTQLSTHTAKSLRELFDDALKKGVDLRLLLFSGMPDITNPKGLLISTFSFFSSDDNPKTHVQAHKEWLELAALGGETVLDTKFPRWGSQHQKYAIFGKQEPSGTFILTAYCGGIDPAPNRRDPYLHQKASADGAFRGWHDVHTKVQGSAAAVILEDFVNRWNEHPVAESGFKTVTTPLNMIDYPLELPPPPLVLNQQVEVLQTYPCFDAQFGTDAHYVFAREGIRTIEEAYLKAIGQAQHYVYLENLFFLHYPISEKLAQQVRDFPDLKVIIVMNYLGNGAFLADRYNEEDVLKPLVEAAAPGQLYVCDIRHPDAGYAEIETTSHPDYGYLEPIYIHSKLMIVDDIYATIGSANLTPRSMTYDGEMNIGFIDTDEITYMENNRSYTVCRATRDFRMGLWAEHLGLIDPAPLEKIPLALDAWSNAIQYPDRLNPYESRAPSRVFDHNLDNMGAKLPLPAFWTIKHPTQNCDHWE